MKQYMMVWLYWMVGMVRMMRFRRASMGLCGLICGLMGLLLCSACQGPKQAAPKGRLHVVATTSMLYDVVRNIAKDSVEASVLMGPGVDPHVYKANQRDLRKLNKADIIVYNGLYLEGKMGDVLKKLSLSKKVVAVAEALPKDMLRPHPNYSDAYDPHVWFDVNLWKQCVIVVTDALIRYDAYNRQFYQQNSNTYLAALDTLELWVQEQVQTLTPSQRILVTAHDAFGYFGQAYGIEVKGLQGISTQSEFGLRDIADMVEYVTTYQVPAVFIESSVSDKALRAVVEGCAANGHPVRIGGKLYSDAMGAWDSKEGTYIGMVEANVRTIVQSLSTNLPPNNYNNQRNLNNSNNQRNPNNSNLDQRHTESGILNIVYNE